MKNIAKTFGQILKFNPWHDRLGMFTSGSGGGAMFSANPNTKHGAAAIARAQEQNPLIGAMYGTVQTPGQIRAKKMEADSRACSNEILKRHGLKADKESVDTLTNFYKKCDEENTVRYNSDTGKLKVKRRAYNEAQETARGLLEKVEIKEENPDYKNLREYVRSTPVKISDYDKGDIADYGNYRKDNFGGVKISNKGLPIDSFYQELSNQFPHLFDSSKQTSPSEQLQKVNQTLKNMKQNSSRKLSQSELDEYSKYMADDIIEYFAYRKAS